MSEKNNMKRHDVVMPIYNLIEDGDNCSNTSGSLWQYYRDGPIHSTTNSESFKYKARITENTPAGGITKDIEIVVPLKYLNIF